MKIKKLAAVSLIGACTLSLSSQAGVLIYEGFDYGLVDGSTMDGVATNATGLTGNYARGQVGTGTAFANYTTTGLSFGSNFYPVTGGALSMSSIPTVNNSNISTQLGAALNTGTVTGTVYTSYLFSLSSTGTPGATSQMRINGAQTSTSNVRFSVLGDGSATRSNSIVQYGNSSVTSAPSGILSLDTTYLALAKFTNLGGEVGSEGTAEMWILTEAGYNDWLTLGGGVEADLIVYAVPNSYLFASQTTPAANSSFSNSEFLSYAVSNASNTSAQSMILDETRWGTTLGDVVAVPEPSTIVLLSVGVFFLMRRHAKRRSV